MSVRSAEYNIFSVVERSIFFIQPIDDLKLIIF
jgi:hypothetical protein